MKITNKAEILSNCVWEVLNTYLEDHGMGHPNLEVYSHFDGDWFVEVYFDQKEDLSTEQIQDIINTCPVAKKLNGVTLVDHNSM